MSMRLADMTPEQRERYLADPARVIRNVGRWKEENPTRARAISVAAGANRRAQDAGADGRLSADDIMALWRRQPNCLGCGDGSGLDHVVPLCRGGQNTTGNLQNLCRSCNSRKGRRLPSEMAA
jgi:5-methylcytosine-specific restriction endonuclease McrA